MRPAYLHVDCDDQYLTATLVQEGEEGKQVCAMATRAMTITEKQRPRLERLLLAASWGVHRLQRCCYYVPELIVVIPDAADLALTRSKLVPPRIRARLIELDSIGCKYQVGPGAWEVNAQLQRLG